MLDQQQQLTIETEVETHPLVVRMHPVIICFNSEQKT